MTETEQLWQTLVARGIYKPVPEKGYVLNLKLGRTLTREKVQFYNTDKTRVNQKYSYTISMTRVIWLAVHGDIPDKYFVWTKDGSKNFAIGNLQCGTQGDYRRHHYAIHPDLKQKSADTMRRIAKTWFSPKAVLTPEIVAELRKMARLPDFDRKAMAEQYGIKPAAIRDAVAGKTFTTITEPPVPFVRVKKEKVQKPIIEKVLKPPKPAKIAKKRAAPVQAIPTATPNPPSAKQAKPASPTKPVAVRMMAKKFLEYQRKLQADNQSNKPA